MSTRRRSSRPSVITVAKDLILFGVGLWIIWRQGAATKADFNWVAMAFGVGLTQAPGAMAIVTLLRTGGSSSPALPESLLEPLESSSPSESTGDVA